jgi:(R)-2-hydroxyglutarate---pyruvate transhydrogenase
LISTGVLSQSPAQFTSLWKLREGVPEAISKEGKAYKYDISVPLTSFKEMVDATREQLQKKGLLHEHAVKHVLGYGHVGDGELWVNFCKSLLTLPLHSLAGNLHLNIVAAAYTPEIEAALEPFIYELVGE